MTPLLRRIDRRLVDGYGLVGCPRQDRDVELDRCLACRELIGATRGPDGDIVEIRCRATLPMTSCHEVGWPPLGPLGGSFRP